MSHTNVASVDSPQFIVRVTAFEQSHDFLVPYGQAATFIAGLGPSVTGDLVLKVRSGRIRHSFARRWAMGQGIDVGDRGTISRDVLRRHREALTPQR